LFSKKKTKEITRLPVHMEENVVVVVGGVVVAVV
jgi:hypothetical protein